MLASGYNLSIALFQENQPGGNISGWAWLIIILFVILVVAWRLISNRGREEFPLSEHSEHAEEAHPAETEATRAAVELQAAAPIAPSQTPDDLVIIEGIGPKISSVLQANGIATFAQLAATQVSQLQQILQKEGLRLADPTTWPEQARLAAAGDWDGLNALQARLKGGRQG
jgi:predicted flap endonuclease-1-like 5' DNA nuclease